MRTFWFECGYYRFLVPTSSLAALLELASLLVGCEYRSTARRPWP